MTKIAAFIDGANLFSAQAQANFHIDYSRLLVWLEAQGDLVRAYYYTAIHTDSDSHQSTRPLVDWLEYNGYALITKPTKSQTKDGGGTLIKGNMDVELAVGMLDMAERVDRMILFTGDGDFRSVVEAVQRKGVRVTVVSPMAMLADELRRQSDSFIDLLSLQPAIEKKDHGRASFKKEFVPKRSKPFAALEGVKS